MSEPIGVKCLTIGCNQYHGHDGSHGDAQDAARDVIEQRGGFKADSVHTPYEKLGSHGLRHDAHRFCGMSESEIRAHYAVNIPAPVTLEGIAAVIGALAPLYGKDTHIAECVDALGLKARELACSDAKQEEVENAEANRKARENRRAIGNAFAESEIVDRLVAGTQGSTIRVWRGVDGKVELIDCRPNSPWKGKLLGGPVMVMLQEAVYANAGGYLAALYDAKVKEAT